MPYLDTNYPECDQRKEFYGEYACNDCKLYCSYVCPVCHHNWTSHDGAGCAEDFGVENSCECVMCKDMPSSEPTVMPRLETHG